MKGGAGVMALNWKTQRFRDRILLDVAARWIEIWFMSASTTVGPHSHRAVGERFRYEYHLAGNMLCETHLGVDNVQHLTGCQGSTFGDF